MGKWMRFHKANLDGLFDNPVYEFVCDKCQRAGKPWFAYCPYCGDRKEENAIVPQTDEYKPQDNMIVCVYGCPIKE